MHTNHLFDLITLCEKSQLDYFQYSENGEEIIFCKNNSEKQSKFTSVIVQNKKQELLFDDIKETKKNISDLQNKNIDPDICIITSPYIGIVHFEVDTDQSKELVVKKGDVVCTIEAMKLFNNVVALVTGKILEILVNEGDEVEYGQPLFKIKEVNYEKI